MINWELLLDIAGGVGLAVIVGLAFLVIPFALLLLGQMLPWLITKVPFIRRILFDKPKDRFNNDLRNYRDVYINQCHPSQVIKRLRQDGIQSIFRNYHPTLSPIQKQDKFCDENTPSKLLQSADPKPINKKFQSRDKAIFHKGNLAQGSHTGQPNANKTLVFIISSLTNL